MKSTKNDDNLIWFDMEMSGLDPFTEHVLEYSIVPTDKDLNILHEGLTLVVHQSSRVLGKMDEWNTEHHTGSGLVDSCLKSKLSLAETERRAVEYILRFVGRKKSPLCGNSVFHDRIFMRRLLPKLNDVLHYRIIDVSTVKEIVRRWYPDIEPYDKKNAHRALEDIYESIKELRYYQQKLFIPR